MNIESKRILKLALAALRAERSKIDDEIKGIEKRLGHKAPRMADSGRERVKRLSAAGRRAISDTMKKRWAAYRAAKRKPGRG